MFDRKIEVCVHVKESCSKSASWVATVMCTHIPQKGDVIALGAYDKRLIVEEVYHNLDAKIVGNNGHTVLLTCRREKNAD